jgi:nitroreductase
MDITCAALGENNMSIELTHAYIKKAIHRSQHCQRNWDLSREIPQEDLDIIAEAATQCPSKQNISYYRTHFVTQRETIEQLYELTMGAIMDPTGQGPVGGHPPNGIPYTNPQTLANLLIVFERKTVEEIDTGEYGPPRNAQTYKKSLGELDHEARYIIERDATLALGISAGYVNLVSNLLGYSTGCCQCMQSEEIKTLLNMKNEPSLMMGVGYRNPALNRKVHHANHNIVFGSFKKQPMELNWIR